MPVTLTESPGLAIWQRTIQPSKKSLTEPAARALLAFRLSSRDLRRADELAAKNAEGRLTQAEEQEMEAYRNVGTALEFLKSKARRSLAGKS